MNPPRQPHVDLPPCTRGAIRIALMTPDDLQGVAGLFDEYRVFYGQSRDAERARKFIAERLQLQDAWILVAKDKEGVIAGFAQVYPSFSSISACRTGILNDLYVAPRARSRGIGSGLLAAVHVLAQALELKRLELSTAHDNHTARRLYERHGWVPDTRFTSYGLSVTQAEPDA